MELLEEFNNLSQGDSLQEYNERFGELRLWLLSINPYLRESYFIWCYTKGLKLKIKSLVQVGRPKVLEEVMELATLHNKSATQELAPHPNLKPNSTISTLTKMEIPNSMSTEIAVLGEGQTIQESAGQEFEVLSDGVLGESEPELAEEEVTEATELAQVEEITIWPNDMSQEFDDDLEEPHTQHFKVTSNPAKIVIFDVASKEQGYLLTDSIGIKSDEVELEIISFEIFENLIAPKVFVVMSAQVESSFAAAASMVKGGAQSGNLVFDPGISVMCVGLRNSLKKYVHTDPKGSKRCQFSVSNDNVGVNCEIDKDKAICRKGLSDLLGYNIMEGTPLFSLKLN